MTLCNIQRKQPISMLNLEFRCRSPSKWTFFCLVKQRAELPRSIFATLFDIVQSLLTIPDSGNIERGADKAGSARKTDPSQRYHIGGEVLCRFAAFLCNGLNRMPIFGLARFTSQRQRLQREISDRDNQ